MVLTVWLPALSVTLILKGIFQILVGGVGFSVMTPSLLTLTSSDCCALTYGLLPVTLI